MTYAQVKLLDLRKTFIVALGMLFGSFVGASNPKPAIAHDLGGILHVLNSPAIPESIKSFNRAVITEGDEKTRAVLVKAFQWPVPSILTVCFDKGPLELRPKIAQAMMEWAALTKGNITFRFGENSDPSSGSPVDFKDCDRNTPYKISIGFVRGGHWSQIGTLSETVFPENSMNLDFNTDPRPDDQTIREYTLHETGHALAFHHEHQSPGAPCSNWAWDRIFKAYSWPGATPQEKIKAMHDNLGRLNQEVLVTGQHAYEYTAYDNKSIMHYSFPADMFTDGTANPCHIPQPTGLSPVDKQAMIDAYGTRREIVEKTRSIDQLLNNDRFRDFHDLLRQQKQRYPD
jgi:hypothetical protein